MPRTRVEDLLSVDPMELEIGVALIRLTSIPQPRRRLVGAHPARSPKRGDEIGIVLPKGPCRQYAAAIRTNIASRSPTCRWPRGRSDAARISGMADVTVDERQPIDGAWPTIGSAPSARLHGVDRHQSAARPKHVRLHGGRAGQTSSPRTLPKRSASHADEIAHPRRDPSTLSIELKRTTLSGGRRIWFPA